MRRVGDAEYTTHSEYLHCIITGGEKKGFRIHIVSGIGGGAGLREQTHHWAIRGRSFCCLQLGIKELAGDVDV